MIYIWGYCRWIICWGICGGSVHRLLLQICRVERSAAGNSCTVSHLIWYIVALSTFELLVLVFLCLAWLNVLLDRHILLIWIRHALLRMHTSAERKRWSCTLIPHLLQLCTHRILSDANMTFHRSIQWSSIKLLQLLKGTILRPRNCFSLLRWSRTLSKIKNM